MRLSEAIALGRVLITKPDPGNYCGCAIAMALAAKGMQFEFSHDAYDAATREWPWITEKLKHNYPLNFTYIQLPALQTYEAVISRAFSQVIFKNATMEQLIDWVRSVEPAEEEAAVSKREVCDEVKV